MATILIVDDEKSMRDFLRVMLEKQGYSVFSAASGGDAKTLLSKENIDLVITDFMMPDINGLDILEYVKTNFRDIGVIMITAYASHNTAIDAMKLGAEDYITKPFNIDELSLIIRRSLQHKELAQENVLLRKELKKEHSFENIVGKSRSMIELFSIIERVSATTTTVLLSGESGTGKELVAKAIHFNSPRESNRFISINCGALPETLLESELFGYEKGAFTGADKTKIGLFEAAAGGTLFLDEIGDMPLPMQVKLLRAMQERKIRRVGGTEELPVDVRIIAATNSDLHEMVKQDKFREDLYYRVNVIEIVIPTLRDRQEDIMVLALHFLDKYLPTSQGKIRGFSDSARRLLEAYSWPGNVRELENIIERALALETGPVITASSLPDSLQNSVNERQHQSLTIPLDGIDMEAHLEEMREQFVRKAMIISDNKHTDAARLLKVTPRSLRYLLNKYEIN
jgi:two-component system response regulator PilR (NtrC family)